MKKYHTKPIFPILLLLLCLNSRLLAQQVSEFTFSHIGQAEGMCSQRIYSIVQTDDGALWWSSKRDVERYNGVSIKHYLLGDTSVYSDNAGLRIMICDHFGKYVKSPKASSLLTFDTKGRIYTFDAIHDRFEMREDIRKIMKQQADLNDVYLTDKGYWLATNKGIYFLNEGTLIPVVKDANANYIIPTNRSLLFCTRQGVLEYTGSQQEVPRAGMKMKTIVAYDVERGYYDLVCNKVWLGGYSSGARVLSYEPTKDGGAYPETIIIDTHNPTRAFYPYDMYTMLVGVDGLGVYKVDRRPQSSSENAGSLLFNANEGTHGVLHGNGVYALIRDIWGNIVVGSYTGGIDIARPTGTTVAVFQHLPHTPLSILNDRVNAVSQTPSGKLLIGTENGVSIYDEKSQTMTHTCRDAVVLDLCHTPRGTILAGTYGSGVFEIAENGTSKLLYSVSNGILKDDHVYRMRYDREGYLWIGSLDGDLVQLTTDGPRYYPINNVKDIMQLPDDRMLIGTTHGLFIIHPSTGKSEELNYYPANENDVNKFIHTLYLDNGRELWIGTDGGGIYIYDIQSKQCRHLTIRNGLPSNFVNSINKDVMGRIIIATERGLSFADPKDPSKIVGVNYCFGVDREYSSRAIVNLSDGNIALGSTTGALVVNPKHIQEINYTANLNIVGVSCSDADDDDFRERTHNDLEKHKLNLSYSQRTFDLLFEAINLRNQSDIVYQYKVDNGPWSPPSDQQYIRFASMEAGDHLLLLRCMSKTCGETLDEFILHINIGQPWWNSWWMWCLYFILLGLLFYGVWHIYLLHEKYMRLVLTNPSIGASVADTQKVHVTEKQESSHSTLTADDSKAHLVSQEDNDAQSETEESEDSSSKFISQATQLIVDNLSDGDFTIDRLCREMAMSRTLFYVKLKSYTGKSPQDFIRIIRLERAAALLRGGRQVADVAALTGFDNPKYFSTVFKKYFGVSPSKYS